MKRYLNQYAQYLTLKPHLPMPFNTSQPLRTTYRQLLITAWQATALRLTHHTPTEYGSKSFDRSRYKRLKPRRATQGKKKVEDPAYEHGKRNRRAYTQQSEPFKTLLLSHRVEQAERQKQLQVAHEQERFREEQEQLVLKREIDVLDEQERSIYGDDELQAQRTRSLSYDDTVQHWLSVNGARKKDETSHSHDVLQTTSCAPNRSSPAQRPLPIGPAVPTDVNAALPADVTQPYLAPRPFTSDKCDGHRSSAPTAQPIQLSHPCHSLLASRLPKPEIPKFNGKTRDWPMFITSFRQSVHDVLESDTDRLNIL
ncbi:hypothetical protein TTRE_0000922401, partial [Trichuris trichiura]